MKTLLFVAFGALCLTITVLAGVWTNYPYTTAPDPTDTFLVGVTNGASTNRQISAQAVLDWTRTNALVNVVTNEGTFTTRGTNTFNGAATNKVATNVVGQIPVVVSNVTYYINLTLP
jgi:hypothetical protein